MNSNHCFRKHFPARLALLLALAGTPAAPAPAQTNPIPTLQIKADQVTARVSPMLYGLMTEEINYSYEGGLYGELIRNRTFQANPTNAVFWSAVGGGSISLDTNAPLNTALNVSLKLDAAAAAKNSPAGIANGGFWGIPVKPKTTYHASFYARAADGFAGPLTVSLQSSDGKTVFAVAEIPALTGDWKKYEVTLKTKKMKPSKDNQLVIATTAPGTIWFSQVSLFPPTYANRANGNRPDLMQLLADLNPKFLRFPGGNYLEGNFLWTRFNWKNTIGDVSQRPGHMNDAWGYWSTDGMGLLEFLNWCEDLHMEPVLAVYAGYALKHDFIQSGSYLEPYVQDALDEIEYVTGGTNTTWGARRAQDGHPAPFPLRYVEVGNEDWFDRSGSYDGRFTQFFDAIKAKYPQLEIIATTRVTNRVPDVMDEHYYRQQEAMEAHAFDYDSRSRDQQNQNLRRRMGHARRQSHAQHGGRARRRRVDDRHGTQLRPRHHVLLRAALRQRQRPRQRRFHAMENGFDRLRRAHQLRFARLLRAKNVQHAPRRCRARHRLVGCSRTNVAAARPAPRWRGTTASVGATD